MALPPLRPVFGPDFTCRCGARVYYAFRPGDLYGRLMNVDSYGPHVCPLHQEAPA